MVNWDSIYRERGSFQVEVSRAAMAAAYFFHERAAITVLDLGCGTGRHTRYLVDQGFTVSGCDSSDEALARAREVVPEAGLERCNMTLLPYDTGSFEAVFCNHVVQHGYMTDIHRAVDEIHRVLRSGGSLYLSVVSTRHPKALTGREVEPNTRLDTDALDGHIPHHFFTEDEMLELFSGFEVLGLDHVEGPSELEPTRMSAAWHLRAAKP